MDDLQQRGWDSRFDGGMATRHLRLRGLADRASVLEVATIAILVAALVLVVIAIQQRLELPLVLYGVGVLAMDLGSNGLMNSKARLLVPAFTLLIPVAHGAGQAPARRRWCSPCRRRPWPARWFGAYSLTGLAVRDLMKDAETSVPVHDLIPRRWSPRALDETAEVTRAQLTALLEAARWAPSCGNTQPARYLVGLRGRDTFAADPGTLTEGNQRWAHRAGALLIGVVVTENEKGDIPYAEYGSAWPARTWCCRRSPKGWSRTRWPGSTRTRCAASSRCRTT